jgi:hypothetical protein
MMSNGGFFGENRGDFLCFYCGLLCENDDVARDGGKKGQRWWRRGKGLVVLTERDGGKNGIRTKSDREGRSGRVRKY